MGLINLEIYPRSTTGKNANRRTRAGGRVPAVIYGGDRTSANMELDAHKFDVILSHLAGSSAIFRLVQEGGGEEAIALLREIQKNPVTDQILHVDLMEIPRGVPVTVSVVVQVVGTNATIKNGEGSVAMALNSIDVSCLPSELPDYLEVDVTDMELNDKILVKDVTTPVGEIITDPESLVLNIKAAAIFVEEEEELEEGAEGAEGEEGEDAEEGDDDKGDDKSDKKSDKKKDN
jgi:large subunit ribosomal protein L25